MGRKLLVSMFVMTVSIGFVAAEEFSASIVKVDGDKVTFFKTKQGKKEGEAMTLPVAKDAKIAKGKFNFKDKKVEVGEALEGGLKADLFKKATEEKGVFARITTSEDNKSITAITTIEFGGLKKKDDKKKKTDKTP